MKPAQTEV